MAEVQLNEDGGWDAPEGSPHRSLHPFEVEELIAMAETTKPRFGGHDRDPDADTPWEKQHPIAQAIWRKRGLAPEGA